MRTPRYFWALAAVVLASCADYSVPDEVVYGELVYTQQDPTFTGFATLNQYWLDTAFNTYEDDPQNPVPGSLLDYPSIISTIDRNMTALGYTKLGQGPFGEPGFPAAPTPGLAVIRTAVSKGSAAYWYGGYWCDPYYYYYCAYDWYYAGSYKYGTVMMSLNDFTVADTGGANLPIRWIAAMYGVASTPAYDIPRISEAMDRAFGQSPYLDTH